MPKLTPHFFYYSPIAIDDPLALLPTPGSFEASWAKQSPRPFSEYDDGALEKAWRVCFGEASREEGLGDAEKNAAPTSSTLRKDSSLGNVELRADSVLAPDLSCEHEVDSCTTSTPRNNQETTIDIPVGVSKLYMVKLPAMQMSPIYWSPINDVSPITRGTWFYKDTLYPVELEVASQLELGYIANCPWRQDWCDELSKAIEVGDSGDQKFRYELRLEEVGKDDGSADRAARSKTYKTYSGSVVCYEDSKTAFILRPGIEQSQYFRLRSLSKIVGGSVGIPVVRGWDSEAWEKLHPSKKPASPGDLQEPSASNTSGQTLPVNSEPQEVTDLVFVVHGVGQKLSLRYEGFSFTYATNSLRQLINADLLNPSVRKGLRNNFGGIAVLPINWRSKFKLGDGEAVLTGPNLKASTHSRHLALGDITPHSIPAVRSLISDVLLDIPFYMSPHKAQMLEAVIEEANRLYRLWCHNNPGFQERGRVHIIGHSLGSALCLDILSRQPTFVAPFDEHRKLETKHFEFNTTNLFFVGSPVGFFLLLGGGKLIPRHGRTKFGIDLNDEDAKEVAGREGTYGCMSVDNLYNIMHYNDPIAYRVNAAVDVVHTALLKTAEVPSSATSWWDTFSSAAENIKQGVTALSLVVSKTVKNATPTSSSENNTIKQDFTIAEKKFLLLNDNGQIDYFLKAAEGPDIQYLNMIWAHGSYWSNLDFVRLLVMEIGRESGAENALAAMKAVRVTPDAKGTTSMTE